MFLQNTSSKKLPNFKSSPKKKYLLWDNETWSESVPDTYKDTEKFQVAAIFRDIAIRILVMDISVKANCTAAGQSEKVCFVESCLGRELKGIASFPASTSSPSHYSIRRNYQQDCIFKGRVSSAVFTSFSF